MSIRDLLAGYAATLPLFVFGCLSIERSGIGLKGAVGHSLVDLGWPKCGA
jgi:hypothetical protein